MSSSGTLIVVWVLKQFGKRESRGLREETEQYRKRPFLEQPTNLAINCGFWRLLGENESFEVKTPSSALAWDTLRTRCHRLTAYLRCSREVFGCRFPPITKRPTEPQP